MKIEVLFPEVCNLYGELFNIRYLKMCLEESGETAEIINTALTETPRFVSEKIDLVYLGTMSEKTQKMVVKVLLPYKKDIEKRIEEGGVTLLTGNAMEIFGQSIQVDEEEPFEGLKITSLEARAQLMKRFNCLFAGTLETENGPIRINAFKSIFGFSYGDNSQNYLFKSIKGPGINKESDLEGFRMNNTMGTYLIGPLLVINPELTKYLMGLMGVKEPKVAFSEEAKMCFDFRMKEFDAPETDYLQ